jgi:hypothetical protein
MFTWFKLTTNFNLKLKTMNVAFQKSQKVITPDGGGLIEDIIGEDIIVKLDAGGTKTYTADELEDDADQG